MIYRLIKRQELNEILQVAPYRFDVRRRVPAVNKAKELLNWEARIRLEEGLPEVIDWIRASFTAPRAVSL